MSFAAPRTTTKRGGVWGGGCGAAHRLDHLSISIKAPRRGTRRGDKKMNAWPRSPPSIMSELSTEAAAELSSISGLVIASYPWLNKSGFLQLRLLQHFLHLLDLQHVHASDAAVTRNNTNKSEAQVLDISHNWLTIAVRDFKVPVLMSGVFSLIFDLLKKNKMLENHSEYVF